MLELRQIKLPVDHNSEAISKYVIKALSNKKISLNSNDFSLKILKKSIDCRKKPNLFYIYTVGIDLKNDKIDESHIISENLKRKPRDRYDLIISEAKDYKMPVASDFVVRNLNINNSLRPVIIGTGPAGLFCAYILALSGLKPIIFERGEMVDARLESVNKFANDGILNVNSNIQFGEGGAGTFSDGKLNTLTKDKYGRQKFVFDSFVKFGAPLEICFDAKPHIGTDILSVVVKNMRNEVISLGGEFHFNYLVDSLQFDEDFVCLVGAKPTDHSSQERIECKSNAVILATGHSSRDTFIYLKNMGVKMEPKSFAVGFRVEHPQEMINISQYGEDYPEFLDACAYKVTNEASNKRRVYSFCMCPGGHVVNASSEENRLCVNGMSYSKRDSDYANSAIIIGVDENDYKKSCPEYADDPLCGMYYQRKLEEHAYKLGEGFIPVQRFVDYENNVASSKIESKNSLGNTKSSNLRGLLDSDIEDAFIESMHRFGKMIDGFDSEKALMYAVESRTSSPVKIPRDDDFMSNISGLFPCGEGAGYAGGITSAAVDGIKVAEAVVAYYNNKFLSK